jgi:hypothetical protein
MALKEMGAVRLGSGRGGGSTSTGTGGGWCGATLIWCPVGGPACSAGFDVHTHTTGCGGDWGCWRWIAVDADMAAGKVYVWRIHSRGEITAVAISDSSFIFFRFLTFDFGYSYWDCSLILHIFPVSGVRRVGFRVAWRHALSLSRVPLGNVPSLADEGGGLAGVDILASEGWGLAGEELRQRGP